MPLDLSTLVTPEMNALLVQTGNSDFNQAVAAQRELTIALQEPLRQGILDGDIVGNLFASLPLTNGSAMEFPLDIIAPGTEAQYTAYTIPNVGRVPEKHVEGDYLMVPTYRVGSSIDWDLRFARDARWDIIARAMQVFETMFVRKRNMDAWKLVIAAGVDRNLLVYDSNAPASFFTKRLVSLAKTTLRRQGGGNLASSNLIRLTDIYQSPEGLENVRSWDLTMIDDVTRREIFTREQDGGIARIFGVNLHELSELGASQIFQTYYTALGGTLGASDTELAIGLCEVEVAGSSFVHPVREQMKMYNDEALHRQQRQGVYGWEEGGYGILDNRYLELLSY